MFADHRGNHLGIFFKGLPEAIAAMESCENITGQLRENAFSQGHGLNSNFDSTKGSANVKSCSFSSLGFKGNIAPMCFHNRKSDRRSQSRATALSISDKGIK